MTLVLLAVSADQDQASQNMNSELDLNCPLLRNIVDDSNHNIAIITAGNHVTQRQQK